MTLMQAGLAAFVAGLALIRRSRPERRAIQAALTRRLRTGLGLSLGGVLLIAVGARIQGQIVLRRWKRTHQAEIETLKRVFERFRPLVESIAKRAQER